MDAAVLSSVLAEGFVSAAWLPLESARDPSLAAWLAEGRHGAMGYLERHRAVREDPVRAFPGYRSVVVAAMEYGGPETEACPPPGSGTISRYARGSDYHEVLKEALLRALRRLQEGDPGLRGRALVDANPLNEKALAAAGGLGWIGKHTNLIDPARGSSFLLGTLLLDRPAPPEARARLRDRCGLCTACIAACPTGAITGPYQLDARLCISYLTIELRDGIPRHLRPLVGVRIFGCDDCQDVCPWNRFARAAAQGPLRARTELKSPDLRSWAELPDLELEAQIRGTALERAGVRGLRRNVLVALGNSGIPAAEEPLGRALRHRDPLLRGHAAWALGALRRPKAAALLREALPREEDPWVAQEIVSALRDSGSRASAQA
jgi:epoxyqueuosine reductase